MFLGVLTIWEREHVACSRQAHFPTCLAIQLSPFSGFLRFLWLNNSHLANVNAVEPPTNGSAAIKYCGQGMDLGIGALLLSYRGSNSLRVEPRMGFAPMTTPLSAVT